LDSTVAGEHAADTGKLVAASGVCGDTTDAIGFGESSECENMLTLNSLYRTAKYNFCALLGTNANGLIGGETELSEGSEQYCSDF
jgi:alkyl sulfatase BDS1-like metallo-beta-lactamase superfamily hydrolase